jgi:acetyl-CoA carboxylase biotin carboxyl carrier protein
MKRRDASKTPPKAKAAPASATRATSAHGLDFEVVRELARIAGEFGLAEIEVDPSGRIRVARGRVMSEVLHASVPVAAPTAPSLAPPPPVEGAKSEDGVFVSSPFVGTFYRAPSPEAAAFIEVGQKVKKGQTVCIVEAMKLMNEIEAEADGVIAEVLAQNGAHIEYGQKLFRITRG